MISKEHSATSTKTSKLSLQTYLAVHEPLQFKLSYPQLSIFFRETPAGLSEVDLSSTYNANVFWGFPQLQFVCPLQLKVLKTPEREQRTLIYLNILILYC